MSSLQDLQVALDNCQAHINQTVAAVNAVNAPLVALINAYETPPTPIDYSSQVSELNAMTTSADNITGALVDIVTRINAVLPH